MALAAVVPYMIAAGAAVSAYSAIRQGQAAKAAGDYNATVNEQNAQLVRQETQDLTRAQARENYLRMGAVRANQGKAGGAANEGSVLDVLADVAAQGELEKQQIAYQGALKERGYRNTARLDRFSGKQALQNSYMKAGSDLLSGAGTAYGAQTRINRA